MRGREKERPVNAFMERRRKWEQEQEKTTEEKSSVKVEIRSPENQNNMFMERRNRWEQEKNQKQQTRRKKIQLEQTRQYTPQLTDLRRKDRQQAHQMIERTRQAYEWAKRVEGQQGNWPVVQLPQKENNPSSSYLPGTEKWKEARKKEQTLDKIGYTEDGRFINYSTIPSRPDYKETVEAAKQKAEEGRNNGFVKALNKAGIHVNESPVETYRYSLQERGKDREDILERTSRFENSSLPARKYALMTDLEQDIYNYIFEKSGKKQAEKYVDSLEAELNARGAKQRYEDRQEEKGLLRVADNIASSFEGGIQGAVKGVKSLPDFVFGAERDYPAKEHELFQSRLLKESQGAEKVSYQVANALGNMAPTIALSVIGGAGAGGMAFATQTGGQTYRQDIMEGRPAEGAQTNAVLTAADEAVTNYLLGGIANYGGGALKKLLGDSKVAKAAKQGISSMLSKNPAAKRAVLGAAGYGADMVSEGTQEVIQDLTESIRKHFIYGDELNLASDMTDPQTWEDFLIGALTAGVLNAPGKIYENVVMDQYGRSIDQDYREYAEGINTDPAGYSNEQDLAEAVDLQTLAREYADRQRRGEFIPNRDKAEYDIRLQRLRENQQRQETNVMGQESPQMGQEQPENQEADKTTPTNIIPVEKAEELSQDVGFIQPKEPTSIDIHPLKKQERIAEEPSSTVSVASENEEATNAYRPAYGKNGGEALKAMYDGNVSVSAYNKAFGRAYDAGYHNMDLETTEQSAIMSVLTSEQMMAAYKAGLQDYNLDYQIRPKYRKGEARTGGLGIVSDFADQNQRKVAEQVGKMTGLKINLVDGMGQEGAVASYRPGEVTISIDSKDFMGSMSHELTHFIRDQVPQGYRIYSDIVVEAQMKATGKPLEDMVEDYINRYGDAGQEISRNEAIEEIVADAAQNFLQDPNFVDSIVKKDRTLAERIVDFLSDVLDSLKALMKNATTREAAKNLEENAKLYEAARDTWLYALEKAGESYRSGETIYYETEKEEKFQLKDPVEETKDMIAVHNLSKEKLEKILKYEGIPMPSIAITKAEFGWEDFGNISMIFRKDTIDPKNKKNKVYGADAWTATFPQIEYDVNTSVYHNAADTVKNMMSGKIPDYLVEKAVQFNDRESGRPENRGIDGVIEAAKNNMGMKAAYLASKGGMVKDRVQEVSVPIVSDAEIGEYSEIERILTKEGMKEIHDAVEGMSLKDIRAHYGEKIETIILDKALRQGMDEQKAKKQVEKNMNTAFRFSHWVKKIANAYEYMQNGPQYETQSIRDEAGINEEINAQINQEDYENWLYQLYDGLILDEGVPNGKEYLTPSGNRRSFKQLHYSITPENIVGFMGVKTLRAAATENMNSIDEIHQNSDRLQNFSVDEYTAREDELNKRLYDVIQSIVEKTGSSNVMATDHVGEIIQEAAGKKSFSEKTVRDTFNQYPFWKVSETDIKEIADIINEVKIMPVNMFEAKPERVVGFDEAATIVMPTNVEQALIEKVKDKGVPVVLYDPNIEGARIKAVNELKDVRFQLEDIDDTGNTQKMQELLEENQSLREANDLLMQQFKLTSKDAVRMEDIKKTAKQFLKQYNSKYPAETLERNLSKLYGYIRGANNVDGQMVTEASMEIARSILKHSQQLDTTLTEQYEDLRRKIRNTKIAITEQDKNDLASAGGYNAFRKQYFGKMKLGKDGISVDTFYQELQSQYPEFFPEDITHPADELMAIGAMIDQTAAQLQNPYHANMDEMAGILGHDIMEAYFDIRSPKATFADKKEAELQAVRMNYHQKMREYKRKLKGKYDEALEQVQQEWKEDKEQLTAAKEEIEAIQLKHRHKLQNMRSRRQKWEDQRIILKEINRIHSWLARPTDTKHVPEAMRTYVAKFLSNIDFSTDDTTTAWINEDGTIEEVTQKTKRTLAWEEAKKFYAGILENSGVYENPDTGATVVMDIDPDLVAKMDDLIGKTKNLRRLADLTSSEMRELKEMVVSMRTSISDINKLKSNQKAEEVGELAGKILEDLSRQKGRLEYDGKISGTSDRIINYDMLDPQTMFGKMGDHMKSIYDSLRGGLDKKTILMTSAQKAVDTALKEHKITPKQLREWTGKNAKLKEFSVAGGTMRLTVAGVMSLYEMSKRHQAAIHMYDRKGGVKPEPRSKRRYLFSVTDKADHAFRISEQEVKKITDTLTPEQKALADTMQRFMGEDCAAWGNEVSMELYGYEKFKAPNYFPITTDKNYVKTKQGDMYAKESTIKNMGMTKNTTPYANNPIIIEDIFDVFTRQVDRMSTYNAYVLPLSDLNKIFNYKDMSEDGNGYSIKEEIERAFGKKANEYIDKLVQDINGSIRSEKSPVDGLISRWKGSAIGGNLRVAIQQPTAYLRAMAEISPKYLTMGAMTVTRKDQWDKICKYAPIAQWKDWGFYKMDTSRQLKDILFNTDSALGRLNNIAMLPAEAGDKLAWNRLWRACEFETRDKHKELDPGSEEFYQETGKRFGEIIDRTQVVDSVLHRTQIMRSTNALTKLATSFMAEPLKSYDMLYRAAANISSGLPGAKKAAAWAGAAYVLSNFATALAASMMDAARDDDREKDFKEKYWENVVGNFLESMSPLNNIPFVKDAWATIAMKRTPVRSDMQGIQDLGYAIWEIAKSKRGESKYTPQYVAVYAAEHASKITGVPVGNIMRDVRSILDSMVHEQGNLEEDYQWLKQKYDMGNKENLNLYASMMIQAKRNGEEELEKRIKQDLNRAEIDNDTIGGRIKKLIQEELITEEHVDPRIEAAVQAIEEKNDTAYEEAVVQLVQEGYSQDLVGKAIDLRMKQLRGEDEIDWEAEEKVAPDELYEEILSAPEKIENLQIEWKTSYNSNDIVKAVKAFKPGDRESLGEFKEAAEGYYHTKLKNGAKKSEAIGGLKSIISREYKSQWIEAYNAGDKKAYEEIQNRLKQLTVDGKHLYDGEDWTSWRKAAKKKAKEDEE